MEMVGKFLLELRSPPTAVVAPPAIASVQGKIDDLILVDDLTDAGAFGFNAQAGCFHNNFLRGSADGQLYVDRGADADFDLDSILDVGAEAGHGDLDAVGAGGDVGNDVVA
jgi:hypothetical protein